MDQLDKSQERELKISEKELRSPVKMLELDINQENKYNPKKNCTDQLKCSDRICKEKQLGKTAHFPRKLHLHD